MSIENLVPYDQLPANVALNPYVRDVYVRNNLIIDDRVKKSAKGRKREKREFDWKIAVIAICLTASLYVYWNLFFAGRSGGPAPQDLQAQMSLQTEIRALEKKISSASTPEEKDKLSKELEAMRIQAMSLAIPGLPPGAIPPLPNIASQPAANSSEGDAPAPKRKGGGDEMDDMGH